MLLVCTIKAPTGTKFEKAVQWGMKASAGYPNIAIVSIDWLRHSYEVGRAAALGPYRVRPTQEQKKCLLLSARSGSRADIKGRGLDRNGRRDQQQQQQQQYDQQRVPSSNAPPSTQ